MLAAALPLVCLMIGLRADPAFAWHASPDATLELGSAIVTPGDVVDDATAPSPLPLDLGPLPQGADLIAYSTGSAGKPLFVLAQATTLPGSIQAGPRIVIARESGAYAVEADFTSLVPAGVSIDALGTLANGTSVGVSFDVPVVLLGTFVDDADVVDLGTLAIAFDASGAGIPAGVDLDAFSEAPEGGDLIVSFDVGGSIGGITYADEDLLRVSYPGPTWSMEVDASTLDSAWERVDLDAVQFLPEPSVELMLLSGSAGLAVLARRRRSFSPTSPSRKEPR
jgi:hypothetical protein